MVTEKKNS